jgi:hypothetical protein
VRRLVVLLFVSACGGGGGGGGARTEPAKPAPPPVAARTQVIEVDAPPEEVPPPEGPGPSSGVIDTGVPECDDYLLAFERLVTACGDKLGPSVDAVKQALDSQKASFLGWRDLDDSSRDAVHQAAAQGCKAGADAIRQTATSMGCTL